MKITYGQELKPGVTYVACTNHFDDDFSPLSETDKQSASNIIYVTLPKAYGTAAAADNL